MEGRCPLTAHPSLGAGSPVVTSGPCWTCHVTSVWPLRPLMSSGAHAAAELPYGGGATCDFCLCTDSRSCELSLSLCSLTSSSPVRGQSVGVWGQVHVAGRPWFVFLCHSTGFQRGHDGAEPLGELPAPPRAPLAVPGGWPAPPAVSLHCPALCSRSWGLFTLSTFFNEMSL